MNASNHNNNKKEIAQMKLRKKETHIHTNAFACNRAA